MYNSEKPSKEELPSTKKLVRSTVIALASAIVILFTVILPSEYGIDPTRIGAVLGLTEMGEIKQQLADEADADEQNEVRNTQPSNWLAQLGSFLMPTAQAAEHAWRDEVSFLLEPGEGIEWKLVMAEGEVAIYRWQTDGGRVNFDLHGDGSGRSIAYEKGRGSRGEEGTLQAPFSGKHGWFWRNRDKRTVMVTLQIRGEYQSLKRTG